MNQAKKFAAILTLMSISATQPFLALANPVEGTENTAIVYTEENAPSISQGPVEGSNSTDLSPGNTDSGSSNAGENTNGTSQNNSGENNATVQESAPLEKTDLTVDAIRPFMTTDHAGDMAADPVLNLVPLATYYIYNSAGERIDYGYSQDNQSFTFSPNGFQRIMLEHQNVGRWYYRTYSPSGSWGPWAASGETTPDKGTVTAIMLRVKGYTHTMGEIYYRAVLSDGTVTDWAKSGEACGSFSGDKYIVGLKIALWKNGVEFSGKRGKALDSAYQEGLYFENGEPKYQTADNSPYTGYAFDPDSNQYYFENGVAQRGWKVVNGYRIYLNEQGIALKDLEPIMGKQAAYSIRINKETRTLYVMTKDEEGKFTIPYKTMMCSVGPDTPLGTFKIYQKYRWHFMHKDCYTQFLSRFYKGFLIHSLLYEKADPHSFDAINYNFIDQAISGGCIRLRAIDSQWVYENCKNGTPVNVYSDAWDKGPIEKDAIMQAIPREQNYDPTDPVVAGKQSAEDAKSVADSKKEVAKEAEENIIEPNA